ncbi:uncharacterized protein LOC122054979 [Zingiber officinale]|uniref:uncharacterized protein LOC122054979 n=1 Tax=Zingiber officinale TaxID=94328 RepID=UPI001C4C8123|nr:uncharacterized protein LOC122054979 [Zingiber officinale]
MCQMLTFLEQEVKQLKASSDQSSDSQEWLEQMNTKMAQLRADLAKSAELLEALKGKTAEQATQIAWLNKQANTFEAKIHLANTRKLWAIEDLEIKNKKFRVLAQNLKDFKAALKAERDGQLAKQTSMKTQLDAKDEELTLLKEELEAS